jgi:hypothetical protein
VRCNLAETEDQQVARYINGVNHIIQDRLGMQQIWSIDQAQTLALKAERLVKTRQASKAPYSHTEVSARSHSHRVEEKITQPRLSNLPQSKMEARVRQNQG